MQSTTVIEQQKQKTIESMGDIKGKESISIQTISVET